MKIEEVYDARTHTLFYDLDKKLPDGFEDWEHDRKSDWLRDALAEDAELVDDDVYANHVKRRVLKDDDGNVIHSF